MPVSFPSLTLICPSVKWVYWEQGLFIKVLLVSRQLLRTKWWLRLVGLGLQPPTAPFCSHPVKGSESK